MQCIPGHGDKQQRCERNPHNHLTGRNGFLLEDGQRPCLPQRGWMKAHTIVRHPLAVATEGLA